MNKIKEFLKDFRIILYLILIISSIIILIPKEKTDYVRLLEIKPENLMKEYELDYGTKIFSINDCRTYDIKSFYDCYNKAGEIFYLETDKGTVAINKSKIEDIKVTEAKKDILNFGIDIVGGIRIYLEPTEEIDIEELLDAKKILEYRLNTYGIRQVDIRVTSDLEGKKYIVIEIPRGDETIIAKLKKQGKFEAKIKNITVFTGKDIIFICKSPECSGIIPIENGYRFWFKIRISKEAAERFYKALQGFEEEYKYGKCYLKDVTLDFYLDNEKIESLSIDCTFKESPKNEGVIEGGASTIEKAREEMKWLQTVLESGALPVKLEISRIEYISPLLGSLYLKDIVIALILALFSVAGVIYLRYRNLKVSTLIIINMIVETIAILAVAKIINWTMDLPSLAGLVVSVGTGVDDQIVITDEMLKGEKEKVLTLKERIKRAFFIVISSYLAFGTAMILLFYAGAGALRGFAVTTLIGISIGALITRPAFAKILEKII